MSKLFDQKNDHDAYFRMLQLWSEVYNHRQYKFTSEQLRHRILDCVLAIWSVKEWFKKSNPNSATEVEAFINSKRYLPIAIDLANMLKHRELDRASRSQAKVENFFGQILDGKRNKIRDLYYISNGKDGTYEIFTVIRGALDEWEEWMHMSLRQQSERPQGSKNALC